MLCSDSEEEAPKKVAPKKAAPKRKPAPKEPSRPAASAVSRLQQAALSGDAESPIAAPQV